MKSLKEIIIESIGKFPVIKDFKKKSGITSIKWVCGNEAIKEYGIPKTGMTDIHTLSWFHRNIDKLDTISISIYENDNDFSSNIYIGNEFIAGRGIQFEGHFESLKEAKTKMYEVLCKIRDDKEVFIKLADKINVNTDKYYWLSYEEFMAL